MPTYQYQCSACQHGFEELQSIKDEPLTKCPKCKKKKLQRLIGTGAGLLFKGSGFYITDYRSESYKKAADGESKPKSDTKPEKKSESPAPAKSSAESPKSPSTPAKSSAKKKHD